MKNIIRNIKENYKLVVIVFLLGMALSWLLFHSSSDGHISNQGTAEHEGHNHEAEEATVWTCSMHPQFKMDKFGLCPICAMDLIPMAAMSGGGEDVDPNELMMSESAAKLASIQTMKVAKGIPQKKVYLQGKIQADERNIAEITSRFGGRIEKLHVNFTGQVVRKGEPLATIYSPALVTAQRELLEALAFKDSRPSLYAAAKGKLKLWDLTDKQISAIEEKGEPSVYFEVYAPISGTVSQRHISIGDYVKEGSSLFELINLSKVWVLFDTYESDLPWVEIGDEVSITVQALPMRTYSAKLAYIDPFLDAKTRVVKVRAELDNKEGELKPEMFAVGILESKIAENSNQILIPKSSALWTGKRAVVYVKVPDRDSPTFLYREIILGPEAGGFYVVADGLAEGEEIAVNGVFKIDAASQLQGLPSMMNPNGGSQISGHQHGQEGSLGASVADVVFTVYGNCSMCKERIENAAHSVHGVYDANWDEDSKLLHLNLDDELKVASIHKAIASVGHDTDLETAADDVYENLHECCKYDRPQDIQNQSIKVYGNCDMCKERIESAVLDMDGVVKADWNSESAMLQVSFNDEKASIEAIHKAVAAVGHDTDLVKAADEVYANLHECCKYERTK